MTDRLETTYYPVADLTPYHRNAHKGNVARIRGSLRDHAQFKPVVVNRGTLTGRPNEVLCGSHTLFAAREEGWTELAAVTVDVDDLEAIRINVVDNPRAGHPEDLGYDERLLLELLADLPDLDGTGYDLGDVEALESGLRSDLAPGKTDPDDVVDVPEEAFCQPGDLWVMGPHRLLCGDATNPDHLSRLVDGVQPGLVYTDPPYGISIVNESGKVGHAVGTPFGGKRTGAVGGAKPFGKTTGPVIPTTKYMPVAGDDSTDVARDAFVLLHSTYILSRHVWWGGNHYAASAGLPDASCWLVWDKETGANTFADAELAWTNYSGAVRVLRHMWNGMLRATERGKRVHPTQKPVALAVWAFDAVHADPGVSVLDVFAGSGSTLIAAHQTDRQALLMELTPEYCDVICRRYQEHTGTKPTREGVPHDFTQTTS